MRLIIYAAALNTAGQNLYIKLQTFANIEQCEYYASIEELTARLRQPLGACAIGILFPTDEEELTRLISMRYLLRDMRVILVLPNGRAQTISNGHVLRPRFVCCAGKQLNDLSAVVLKMIDNSPVDYLQAVNIDMK